MSSKIKLWLQHPVTQALNKVLIEAQTDAQESILNMPEDVARDRIIKQVERLKVITEILDYDNLLLGELEEDIE